MSVLVADRITLYRGGRPVLREVSLTARSGRLLVLVGPNGAGKSTLLGALSGRLAPDAGSVTLEGRALSEWAPRELARRRAMLSQRVDLEFGFGVDEVVALGRSPHPADTLRDARIVDAALRAAHAWNLRDRNYTGLSGGEQQRVQLARVLAQVWDGGAQGCWLLLDEPEAGLDIAHQHFILRRAKECAEAGFGVIAVLHDLNLAARYADDIAVLAEGELRRHGAPEDALDPSLLSGIYGIPLAHGMGIDAA
ncbi:MAG: Hemin import ATP-binding protein HmuV [Luteibacter sp.]|uniref:heme ABC transporter ATP-binding protein n=1 Tax=Luteibacter sp. TaxID=1886636 RepID=UPI001380D68B|nr:heme ABC transporter ATP-binding protein [Luteibacter sp.]KAF1007781.1 MAG: Hemin import ATP-binding protein HmuV [Luteibacter sp.]